MKKLFLTLGPPTTFTAHPKFGLVWSKQLFLYFCYLIRVEHEKFSEMCVWIVRFGQNLRKWDYF